MVYKPYDWNRLRDDLIRHEGWRDQPYQDQLGIWTVGVGHNIQAAPLCPEAIEAQLEYDRDAAEAGLDRQFPRWRMQTHERQRVLLNMAFQLGIGGVSKFRKMWNAIHAGDYNEAADQMLDSKWAAQTPERANELASRMRNEDEGE